MDHLVQHLVQFGHATNRAIAEVRVGSRATESCSREVPSSPAHASVRRVSVLIVITGMPMMKNVMFTTCCAHE